MYNIYLSSELTLIATATSEKDAKLAMQGIAGVQFEDKAVYSDEEDGDEGTMYELQNGKDTYYCCNEKDVEQLRKWVAYLHR